MRLMLLAATALTVTGSAFAYQTVGTDVDPSTTASIDATTTTATMTADPSMAVAPPHSWTAEQRALWDQHMALLPAGWTADQRATFEAMMALPPASWDSEQRALYEQHMASLPSTWSPEQRTMYEQQVASLRTPWLGTTQTAAVDSTATAGGQANLQTFAGMGGPYEEAYGTGNVSLTPRPADKNYPPCSPGPGDDNCIQLYERGVREQLASWNRPTGGLIDGASTTAMGGPYEPADQSDAGRTATQTGTTGSTDLDHSDHMENDPMGTTQDDTTEPDRYNR